MSHINLNQPSVFTLLLFFALFSTATVASNSSPWLTIEQGKVKLEKFKMGYFVDKTAAMTLDEVRQQRFKTSPNSVSLGTSSKVTWAKINLENVSQQPIKLFLHHPYAYHNQKVELYEVVDGQLVRERILDMDNEQTLQWMYRGSAVFDILLENKKTLYVKSISFSHQWFSLNIYDEELSKRALTGQFSDIALLVGMLLALIVYNFLLFFSSRIKEHFYYACYLISGGFWIALSYGLLADFFNVFGSVTLKWHLSLVAMPIFLLLFMIQVFEMKKRYPIEYWALLSMIILLTINFVYGLFDIVSALSYSSTLAAVMMAVSLGAAFSMLIRKNPVAFLFLLGHGLFVAFSALAVLFYKGKIEFNYINSHGVGIGIMLESLVLSLIMAYRIKTLESLKAKHIELELLASTDPLTRLYNRRYFDLAANKLLASASYNAEVSSLIIIDIDCFKQTNDTYGHLFGDKVIQQVADITKSLCRQQDIVARYGGEEFIILMPQIDAKTAFIVAERIRKKLAKTSVQLNQEQFVNFTVSIGVSEIKAEETCLDDCISRADKALYKGKKNGRNQSQLFLPECG